MKVSHYQMHWNTKTRIGAVRLIIPNGPTNAEVELTDMSAQEFHVVSTMLRNEKPIFWDPESGMLYTGSEMVGEEEL
ncbi:MAG: hypothetical protein JNM04_05060 [Chthonomonas sp.]|nr:hypothetical protein [Chthonomonas sp.]